MSEIEDILRIRYTTSHPRDMDDDLIAAHGDVPQLATSIQTLLSDPALGREMGARGRERVNREFKFGVFAKSLKKLLRELCES